MSELSKRNTHRPQTHKATLAAAAVLCEAVLFSLGLMHTAPRGLVHTAPRGLMHTAPRAAMPTAMFAVTILLGVPD
jgi:hypothetical protein